mmetsp:Transcript_80088/g.248547  ORF Transcript_80088/g.248547 Transcript_80088/m.248547 type:complete len:353 (+) Transcript_80088:49-1107(+)|eukprot:CAMPEP_0204589750 /NCGR_PEP_ID=MMETSP0661-20131031/49384_1 /ASSEMBLY_ACC=CAM_ASM_000606 /TAXON_ID=109239 /ORGANISM="Alexandrium margalefi, Strain AMGDE01CS-322" /LENGTH=352 /DNA_ID=CAMNT_0051599701 /DNA_START=39 /DNA_END=1097 /DNA_ORIENTATION=+
MDEINGMFEAVHTSKWLPLVAEHTFASTLEELSEEEEAALLKLTQHVRAPAREPAPNVAAVTAVDGVAARLDAIITRGFSGAAFVKLGDFAPKDVPPPATLENEWRARLAAQSTPHRASNAGLAAYVWARSRALRVTSGAAALELLSKSERTQDELERRMFARLEGGVVKPLCVTLRAWEDDVDPAYEFRCWVVNDDLVAASDMASHELVLHYPAVLARREELRASLSAFFRAHLARALAPITAATPERCYVLDLMLVGKRWYIIELNPFATSSAGHRFAGAEYAGLCSRSLGPGELPELRLLERTLPLSSQTEAAVPPRWHALLEGCGDRYDIAETDFDAFGTKQEHEVER